MLCNQCGHENSNTTALCASCGQSLAQTPPPLPTMNNSGLDSHYAPPKTLSTPSVTSNAINDADAFLAAYVGDKYQSYYRDKWFKERPVSLESAEAASQAQGFNVAAFFLGIFWLCYRKMYKAAFIYMAVVTVLDLIVMRVLSMDAYEKIGNMVFMIAPAVVLGVLANRFYLQHCIKQIKQATSTASDTGIICQQLSAEGGTTWLGAFAGAISVIVMMGVMYYLFAPSWYM